MTTARLSRSHDSARRRFGDRGLVFLTIVAIGVACAVAVRAPGCSQSSHYSLVRALSAGTPSVDGLGLLCDSSTWNGHTYSNKAPGLALFSLPWYFALDVTEALPDNEANAIWATGLWGSTLPLVAMLCLLAWVVIRLELGPAAFVVGCTGIATLALPLGSLFFSHSLSTALGFGAFAVLLRTSRTQPRLRVLALGGLLAGLSVTTDYPLVLLAALLGAYAAWGPPRLLASRVLAYGAGLGAGIAPLLAYNAWAFGSPFHVSYTSDGAATAAHTPGLWGVQLPAVEALAATLVADRGLLVTTPVVAAGVAGLALLLRSERLRLEAAIALAVVCAFMLYEASLSQGHNWPFGGASPGARFLLPAVPFAMLGIGPAFRKAPAAVATLAAISAVQMSRAFITSPVVEDAATWSDRLRKLDLTQTVVTLLTGSHGWLATLPILAALAVAVAAASASAWRTAAVWRGGEAAAALSAWALVAITGPRFTDGWQPTPSAVAISIATIAILLVVAAARSAIPGGDSRGSRP